MSLLVGAPAAILQPAAGDYEARVVARTQPAKLAALEGQFATERGAPLRIGGSPDVTTQQTRYAVEIPGGLSFMAYGDRTAEVRGLDGLPARGLAPGVASPPDLPVDGRARHRHGAGVDLGMVATWQVVERRALLWALVIVAPFGFLATEMGWIVTEVGRQPWVIQGLLRTADAVTPMPGIIVPSVLFTLLYLGLAGVVVMLIRTQVRETPRP